MIGRFGWNFDASLAQSLSCFGMAISLGYGW